MGPLFRGLATSELRILATQVPQEWRMRGQLILQVGRAGLVRADVEEELHGRGQQPRSGIVSWILATAGPGWPPASARPMTQ